MSKLRCWLIVLLSVKSRTRCLPCGNEIHSKVPAGPSKLPLALKTTSLILVDCVRADLSDHHLLSSIIFPLFFFHLVPYSLWWTTLQLICFQLDFNQPPRNLFLFLVFFCYWKGKKSETDINARNTQKTCTEWLVDIKCKIDFWLFDYKLDLIYLWSPSIFVKIRIREIRYEWSEQKVPSRTNTDLGPLKSSL